MKKLFTLVLALCLIAGLLSMTAVAADPTVTVTFTNSSTDGFSLSVAPGTTAYVITDDALQFVKWANADAPTDKFIKFDYPADGTATLKVTLNNINADSRQDAFNNPGIEFGEGEYAIVLESVGENTIQDDKSAGIKYNNAKGMTITGSGTLSLSCAASAGAFWANGGDLLIQNTTMNISATPDNNSKHHAIFASKGNVTIDGAKVNFQTVGGGCVWLGTEEGRTKLDPSTERKVEIKNSVVDCKVQIRAFETTAPVIISNSTVTVTKGSTGNTTPIFIPAPTLEGEYTAIAGLAKNADKLDKLKEYDVKKLGSYTYFHVVPGIVDLLPSETEETQPETQPTTEATQPETQAPTTEATEPETQPTTEATQPETQAPTTEATQPETQAPTTEATEPVDTDGESGSPLKVVLIVILSLVVVAGAGVGVLFFLEKKGLLKK